MSSSLANNYFDTDREGTTHKYRVPIDFPIVLANIFPDSSSMGSFKRTIFSEKRSSNSKIGKSSGSTSMMEKGAATKPFTLQSVTFITKTFISKLENAFRLSRA